MSKLVFRAFSLLAAVLTIDSEKGHILWDPAKIRDRNSQDFREKGGPHKFIEMYPWLALRYEWVSPGHKHDARELLLADQEGRFIEGEKSYEKRQWRIILERAEKHLIAEGRV